MQSAEHPALRFVNSVEDDGKTRNVNGFRDLDGLLRLVADPGLTKVKTSPLENLLAFREELYLVLSASAASVEPDYAATQAVQAAISTALSHTDVSVTLQGLRLQPGPDSTQVDHLALSAYDLMTSDDFARLSECHRCTRMFIDHGRGKGRRWCDMARCGNRAKAESYRARKRAAGIA